MSAIEHQVNQLKKDFPSRKVGLVTFNDSVSILGDGSADPYIFGGYKLTNYEACLQEGAMCYDDMLIEPVSISCNNLVEKFEKMEEKGKTALGPGLLASIGMASKGKKGSTVVVCTDGLANVGIGSMESDVDKMKSEEEFEKMKVYCNANGIKVNVITMKGEECNVHTLGTLAHATGGMITRVNPEKIQDDFGTVLKDEIIAMNL